MTPKSGYDQGMKGPQIEPVTLLPGPTAAEHVWTRIKLAPFMLLSVIGAALPPPGALGRAIMIASIAAIAVLIVAYLRIARKTARIQQGELALGYTTVWRTARDQPGLWFLHDKTKEVVSGPFQPRPSDTRKSTMEAWMGERRRSGASGPVSS